MKTHDYISKVRQASRSLIRELGMLQLNQDRTGKTPQHWHALIEIDQQPRITISELSELLLLSFSSTSRIVDFLIKNGFVTTETGIDKREKRLSITKEGKGEIAKIDEFSNPRIIGALNYLTEEDQAQILHSLQKYSEALKQNRLDSDQIRILTLPSSRQIRKQVLDMIENIQKNEFSIPITEETNASILKAEETYHFNNTCHFWYAINKDGMIIGSIGLKKIDDKKLELKKFFTHQNYRGKGVAKKLLKKALQMALKNNYTQLYLGTVDLLKSAHRFYQKMGFEEIPKEELPPNFEVCSLDSIFYKGKIEGIRKNVN